HVDRARTEEELLSDLAVGAADRQQAHDLALTTREAARLGIRFGAAAQATDHGVAERRCLLRRLGGQRASAELARRAVRGGQAREARVRLRGAGAPHPTRAPL